MGTSDFVLAKFLQCDVDENKCLDSIVMAVDEFFDDAPSKTLDGLCENVYQKALEYLTSVYQFAFDRIKANPNQYDGSVLQWDSSLLKESLDLLNPKNDLHWGFSSSKFYLELDYWDLYWSVCETINDDFNSGLSMRTFDASFTREVYGGDPTPGKFESLLL